VKTGDISWLMFQLCYPNSSGRRCISWAPARGA